MDKKRSLLLVRICLMSGPTMLISSMSTVKGLVVCPVYWTEAPFWVAFVGAAQGCTDPPAGQMCLSPVWDKWLVSSCSTIECWGNVEHC